MMKTSLGDIEPSLIKQYENGFGGPYKREASVVITSQTVQCLIAAQQIRNDLLKYQGVPFYILNKKSINYAYSLTKGH